jgi:C4-dicarboxylate-specific signal transduction histidine kinase
LKRINLSKKLVIIVLSTSTIFTTLTSIFQVMLEYEKVRDEQTSELAVFKAAAVASIQNLVWNYSQDALDTQIKEALQTADFLAITVQNESHQVMAQSRKDVSYKTKRSETYVLKNPTNSSETIGYAVLEYTDDIIIAAIERQALIVIGSNFVKTLFVSLALFYLFRKHVVIRLNAMSAHFRSIDWYRPTALPPVPGSPPFRGIADEITDIEESVGIAVTTITEYIAKTEELTKSSARLAELGIFSAGISHEINNPLAIIAGTAELLVKSGPLERQSEEFIQKHVRRISQACKRISAITGSLRTFARDGSQDPFAWCTVQSLVEELRPIVEVTFAKIDVAIEFKVSDANLKIRCRRAQFLQIMINLINNASQAIEHLTQRWIRIEAFASGDGGTTITVTDSGAGIPQHVREKIFLPFYTTKEVGMGTGLGLAIVHGIISDHNAKISVNSACPNTQFEMTFPKIEVADVDPESAERVSA